MANSKADILFNNLFDYICKFTTYHHYYYKKIVININ